MIAMTSIDLFVSLVLTLPAAAGDGDESVAPRDEEERFLNYGFSGMIISKLNDGVTNLTAADVDGDGVTDLAVVNNPRSKIEFLIHGAPTKEESSADLVNELPDEVFFKREAYPTEQKVSSIAIEDMDGDGRPDLLLLGDSGRLTIAYRDENGNYGRAVSIDVADQSSSWHAVRPADLNQDGRIDVAVLGRTSTHLFLQGESGRFTDAEKLPNATKDAGSFLVTDLNADGLLDLFYVDYNSEWPFRYRLGEPQVKFGPEVQSRFAEIRSYALGELNGGAGAEVVTVRRKSGRLAFLRFGREEIAGEQELPLSSLRARPYDEIKDADKREDLLLDLDGDGMNELIVTEPAGARIVVHRSLLGGGASTATPYPSFVGTSRPRLADVDGDGRPEIVIAAPAEGAIGVAKIDDKGGLDFPAAVAVPNGHELLALEAADLDKDGTAEIVVALADGKGRTRDRRIMRVDARTGESQELASLKDLKTDPSDLWLIDVNRDGRDDIVVFEPREVPTILVATDVGFTDLKAAQLPTLGILQGRSKGSLAYGDVDGDGKAELVVPGPNFARAFHIDASGKPQSVGQYNLDNASADVTLVAIGDVDGGGPEILAVDKASSSLVVLGLKEDGAEQLARVDLGGFVPTSIRVVDLDRNGRGDVLLSGSDRFCVVQNGGTDPVFRLVDDLEVPIKEAFLDQVALGDVNGDGKADAVVTESSKHFITISPIEPDSIDYALKFQVFEERIFERGGRGGREPREVVVGDFTGDDRKDIAILVHDRLIVYPQE